MKELTDEALAVEIPRLFPTLFPDNWKHKFREQISGLVVCIECTALGHGRQGEYKADDKSKGCVPTPIDINDYNVAHKVFRAAWMEYGWAVLQLAMRTVFEKELAEDASRQTFSYFLFHATPADYLRAALLAREGE